MPIRATIPSAHNDGPLVKSLRPVGSRAIRGITCLLTGIALLAAREWFPGRTGGDVVIAFLLVLQTAGDSAICLARRLGSNAVRRSTPCRYQISKPASPIRESWRAFPFQSLLTRLSGKPLLGEAATTTSPKVWLIWMAGELILGVVLSGAAVNIGGLWAWPFAALGVTLTTHILRLLALMVMHECAHDTYTGDRRFDGRLGDIVGVLLLGRSFGNYRTEHRGDHHGGGFMTEHDPTVAFQRNILGLDIGMSRAECWTRLLATVLSPVYHIGQTIRRLRANWTAASRFHRYLLALYALLLSWLVVVWPAETSFAWLLPVIVLTNVSVAVRACFEHTYPPHVVDRLHSRAGVAACTHGVFFGSIAPSRDGAWPRRWLGYLAWTMRMIGYHAVARALFCPGGSCAHDFHHRHPLAGLRFDPLYARQAELATVDADRTPYTEVWSLHAAIDECFRANQIQEPDLLSRFQKEHSL
jgi:fatty acid desaturase